MQNKQHFHILSSSLHDKWVNTALDEKPTMDDIVCPTYCIDESPTYERNALHHKPGRIQHSDFPYGTTNSRWKTSFLPLFIIFPHMTSNPTRIMKIKLLKHVRLFQFPTINACIRFCFSISAFDVTGQRNGKSQWFIWSDLTKSRTLIAQSDTIYIKQKLFKSESNQSNPIAIL